MKRDIVRNIVWMFAGRSVRVLIQAVYFLLIARTLDVSSYGAFVGTLALVGILSPFASLGSGNLLVKNVSRDRSRFRESWGNALRVTLIGGGLLLVLVAAISRFVLPASLAFSVVLLIALADLIFFRLTELSAQAFQSVERLDQAAGVQVAVSMARLIGAGILAAFVHAPTVEHWSMLYMATTAVAGVVSVYAVSSSVGKPSFAQPVRTSDLREGAHFSTSLSAQTIYNDLDKVMLARLSTLEATGIYGVAYRLVDVSFMPVSAVLSATYSRFFRHGERGIAGSGAFARRILPKAGAYGLLVWLALFALAPILPAILGHNYSAAVEAIRWLAPIPFLRCLHYFLADAITGAGYQAARSAAQLGVAAFNFLLNLWLLPLYGWRGAAWSSLASDALLLVSVAAIFWYLTKHQASQPQPAPA